MSAFIERTTVSHFVVVHYSARTGETVFWPCPCLNAEPDNVGQMLGNAFRMRVNPEKHHFTPGVRYKADVTTKDEQIVRVELGTIKALSMVADKEIAFALQSGVGA